MAPRTALRALNFSVTFLAELMSMVTPPGIVPFRALFETGEHYKRANAIMIVAHTP